ncbi:MAG: hypothetical protein JO061_23050 [Acidobacteriaceae bacterium]|nr:hypothetical protein [Acidobacteriaceae bacterium]
MAKSKNDLSTLVRKLSRPGSNNSSKLLQQSPQSASVGKDTSLRSQSMTAAVNAKGLSFGHTSHAATTTQQHGSELTNFLQSAAVSGVSGALSGALSLGSFGGLGTLISGIASLFGGGSKSTPALLEFTLPDSVNSTVRVNGARQQTTGTVTGSKAVPLSTAASVGVQSTSFIQSNNQQVAQAVRTALLQSSSLSDVINEL